MKLFIRQKVFTWRDKFEITDEGGAPRYRVEGEFSFGKKLHVYDNSGAEVAYVEQKLWHFKPRCEVFPAGGKPFTVVKNLTFLRQSYTIQGTDWSVEGDFMAHSYEILRGGLPVATVKKEWFTFGDFYTVEIPDPAYELTALTIVLVIDCALAQASGGA